MRSRGVGLVLAYHRVADVAHDPFSLCVAPQRFEQQLRALTDLADVVPLRSVFDAGEGRRVAITFDDGYLDNLVEAHPRLRAAGLPATVFVTSGVLGSTAPFWWDRLAGINITSEPRRALLELTIGRRRVRLAVRDPAQRERALAEIQHHLRRLPRDRIEPVVDEVLLQLGEPGSDELYPQMLDRDGVRALARDGLVEIGGHTRTHSMLSGLTGADQWSEIAGCKEALEAIVGRPVRAFAYPFGNRRSYTPWTVRRVRRAGFDVACTTREAPVRRGTSRYRAPRLTVRDWDAEELTRQVLRVFGGDR